MVIFGKNVSFKNIILGLLLLFVFLTPFGFQTTNYVLALFCLGTLLTKDLYQKSNWVSVNKVEKIFIIVTLLYCIWCFVSLLWTDNIKRGLQLSGRYVVVFLLPFFIFLAKISGIINDRYQLIIKAFIWGVLFSSVICLIMSFCDCFHYSTDYGTEFYTYWFCENWFESIGLGYNHFSYIHLSHFIHPSYYCLYFIFSLICGLHLSFKNRILKICFVVYCIIFIYLLQSRSCFVALLIISIIFLLLSLRKNIKKIVVGLCLFILLIGGMIHSNRFNSISSVFHLNAITMSEADMMNNYVFVRYVLWKSAFHVINGHYILGVGIGDSDDEIQRELQLYDIDSSLGTHNQYIYSLMSMGIIGLLLLLSIFFIAFYCGIKYNKALLVYFTIAVMVCLFFENMLTRMAGLMFIPWCIFVLILNSKDEILCLKQSCNMK